MRTPAHLFQAYDWRFLAEAAFLGILVALASFQVFIHFLRSRGFVRHVWLGLSSVVAGLGLWAADFSVMLAYDPGQAVVYDRQGDKAKVQEQLAKISPYLNSLPPNLGNFLRTQLDELLKNYAKQGE